MKKLPWTVFVFETIWWTIFIGLPISLFFLDLTVESTAIISGIWIVTTWMHFVSPNIIFTRHVTLPKINKTPLRIALISDLHAGPFKRRHFFRRLVKKINAEMPDVVLIPGDFLLGLAKKYTKELFPLAKLEAPTFCTLGNHDHWLHEKGGVPAGKEALTSALRAMGLRVLINESEPLFDGLCIAGVDDNHFGYHDLSKALRECDKEKTILLAHSPDIIDELNEKNRPALTVCGHTHGGQISLPMWLGHLKSTVNIKRMEFIWGWFKHERMFVTMGVGESASRARWWAWPEIVILNCSE